MAKQMVILITGFRPLGSHRKTSGQIASRLDGAETLGEKFVGRKLIV